MRLITALLISVVFVASAVVAPRGSASADAGPRDQKVAAAAEALRGQLVATRRDFHMHPELSNREERTARVVAERLRALGLTDIKTGVGKHGVTALLVGGKPGPVVAVRADMDALPIQEVDDRPYKSQTPSVMHACGHDVHTTVELGVAEVLSKMKDEVRGTVKFIFQPAEEGAPAGEEGGAKLMIKEGALDNPRPQAIFGLHTEPNLQAGTDRLSLRPGDGFGRHFLYYGEGQGRPRRAAAERRGLGGRRLAVRARAPEHPEPPHRPAGAARHHRRDDSGRRPLQRHRGSR